MYLDNTVNIDAGNVDLIRLENTSLNNLLHLSNGDLCCSGHGRIEVSSSVSITQQINKMHN